MSPSAKYSKYVTSLPPSRNFRSVRLPKWGLICWKTWIWTPCSRCILGQLVAQTIYCLWLPVSCVHAVVSDTYNVTMRSFHTYIPALPISAGPATRPPFVQKCKKIYNRTVCVYLFFYFGGVLLCSVEGGWVLSHLFFELSFFS